MLQIIKGELSYVKWPIIITSSLILIVLLYEKISRVITYGSLGSLAVVKIFLIPQIIVVCFIISLVMLYFEIKENRLRMQSILPLARYKLGIARITTPILLFLIYLLLAIVNDIRIPKDLWAFWLKGDNFTYGAYNWFGYLPYNGNVNALTLMATLIVLPRLFTEYYGRWILGILGFSMILHGYLMPIVSPLLASRIGDIIFRYFESGGGDLKTIQICLIILIGTIFISFETRNNFT